MGSRKTRGEETVPLSLRLARHGFRTLGPLAPRLAGGLAYARFLTPSRHEAPAREEAWLAGAQCFVVPAGRRTVRAYRWLPVRDGATLVRHEPTVLLVHGWAGRGSQMGAFAAPLVERGFRVVAFDAPAHGATAGRRTDVRGFTRAIHAVAGALGPLHAVVAHSFGGACAVLAISEGLRAERVVTLGSVCRFSDGLAKFAQVLSLPPAVTAEMRRRAEQRYGPTTWEAHDADAIAPQLRVPALIVHDRQDRFVDFAQSEALAAAWPGARLRSTEGLGHHRILRDPGVVTEVVEFIDQEISKGVERCTAA